MKLNYRNLRKLGFTSTSRFCSLTDCALCFRVRGQRVEYAHNYVSGEVGYFTLTPIQLAAFKLGKLTLVPSGFCSVTNTRALTNPTVLAKSEDEVKSLKHLEKMLLGSA
jgi:hypothetical protein